MPARARCLLLGPVLALPLLAGCSGEDADRVPGDPVTPVEADLLAGLLAGNREAGGADFVVTAPYAEGSVLTLTGEVDFAEGVGRAQAVVDHADDRPDRTRTVFFTADQLWIGDVPGLTDTLSAAGLPAAGYVRRPLAEGAEPPLLDLVARMVLNLSAAQADDPAAFAGNGYSWEGERSIDQQLAVVYRSDSGWEVAVDSSSDLLTQFTAPVAVSGASDAGPAAEGAGGADVDGAGFDVTVTLTDHGERRITVPAPEETVDGQEHPEIAARAGF